MPDLAKVTIAAFALCVGWGVVIGSVWIVALVRDSRRKGGRGG